MSPSPAPAADRTAFVSGGSAGIGLASVLAFVEAGYTVVTCGRHRHAWDACVAAHPQLAGSVDFQPCDLTDAAALAALFAHIAHNHAPLHVAVNNAAAAIASAGPFVERPQPALLATLLQDFWMPTLCLHHELPLMAQGGAIVNVSSINGQQATPGAAMYAAAKAGLDSLTKSLALEAIGHGVRINAVAPGVTWTPRWASRIADGQAARADVEALVPLKRFAQAEEIAAAILWLCSDAARYVVGHTLVIDGGLSLT